MAERAQSTLGYERFCNIFMADQPEEAFVDNILKTVPPFPDYYRRMKRVNAKGPKLLEVIPGGEALSAREFREALKSLHAVLIDLRRPEAFGGSHVPGSFNIGAGQNLSMWAGWGVPYDRPVLLVGDEGTDMEGARRSLIRVGFDDIRGYLKGGMRSWIEAGFEQAHMPQESVMDLAANLPDSPFVLDVRSEAEWNSGHIVGRNAYTRE
jgi:hydroxyacylglutathione hydrolase